VGRSRKAVDRGCQSEATAGEVPPRVPRRANGLAMLSVVSYTYVKKDGMILATDTLN